MSLQKLLLIEDDNEVAEQFKDWFDPLGYEIVTESLSPLSLTTIRKERPSLLVLDILLGDARDVGFDILRDLRRDEEFQRLPVVIYSILGNDTLRRIQGMRYRANYFLPKSDTMAELEVTIQRALEIAAETEDEPVSPQSLSPCYDERSGDFWVDKIRYTLPLSRHQRLLLAFLWSNRNLICYREHIAQEVYPEETDVTNQQIDRLIGRLRRKLQETCPETAPDDAWIANMRGLGYKLYCKRL